jgi:DNA polymerase/3'-5' exonuclease PolX
MAISLRDLTVAQLKKAVAIKERMEQLEKDLTGILGIPESMTVGGVIRRRRKMSAAARAKISAAAKARWAKVNAGKPATTKPAKVKRTMSAAARAKISAAAKARWAKVRAGKQ